jgi:hypothetical protein
MRLLSANFFMAIVLIAAMPSCAQKITRPTADRYSLNIIDDIEARRFNLSLNSIDNRALCVSIENWPDSLGHFMVENNDVSLRIGQNHLKAKSTLISVYCPGGCGEHRIEPNDSLRGFISYDVFDDSETLAAEREKILNFPVTPRYCP